MMRRAAVLCFALVTGVACASSTEPETPGAPFDGDLVHELVDEDGSSIQAYVVGGGAPAAEVAEDCADHFASSHDRVHCYVFRDEAAFEAAGAPVEFGMAMKNLCWDAFVSRNGSNTAGKDTNPEFDPEVCS
jgi:hypothetical protein